MWKKTTTFTFEFFFVALSFISSFSHLHDAQNIPMHWMYKCQIGNFLRELGCLVYILSSIDCRYLSLRSNWNTYYTIDMIWKWIKCFFHVVSFSIPQMKNCTHWSTWSDGCMKMRVSHWSRFDGYCTMHRISRIQMVKMARVLIYTCACLAHIIFILCMCTPANSFAVTFSSS